MEGVVVIDTDFWRGKRVLVTGHTGFKGAWLSLWLKRLGAHVMGYSIGIPTEPSLFQALSGDCVDSHIEADVRDLARLSDVIASAKPEIVFHLAAQSLVRASYDDPVGTYATNVMGTVHLLEAVRQAGGVRAVINVTSDKCYENREIQHAYTESDPLGGHDPYSSSKGCAELVTNAYRLSFLSSHAVGVASVRAGNVIGGGDWSADRLIPDCARAFSAGREVVVRNPKSVRPWQHVLDALRGYLLLGQRLYKDPQRYSKAFNFGPEARDARPVGDVVSALVMEWGEGASSRIELASDQKGPHEAHLLMLDSSVAREVLGWRSLLSFEEGVAITAQWYKAFYAGRDLRSASLEQLARVEALQGGAR
jgi:CDP-glucose 4,6-dehydratase